MNRHTHLLHNYVGIAACFGGEPKMVEHIANCEETRNRFLGVFGYAPDTHRMEIQEGVPAGIADAVIYQDDEKDGEKAVRVVEFMSQSNGGQVDANHYRRLPEYCIDHAAEHGGTMVCSPIIPPECLAHFCSVPMPIDFLVVTGVVYEGCKLPILEFHRHPICGDVVKAIRLAGHSDVAGYFQEFIAGLCSAVKFWNASNSEQVAPIGYSSGERRAKWGEWDGSKKGVKKGFTIRMFGRLLTHQFIIQGTDQSAVRLFEHLNDKLPDINAETGFCLEPKPNQWNRRILLRYEVSAREVCSYDEQQKSAFYEQIIRNHIKFVNAIQPLVDEFDKENPA